MDAVMTAVFKMMTAGKALAACESQDVHIHVDAHDGSDVTLEGLIAWPEKAPVL